MSPVISVIVPVYNVEKYLRRALDSVVNQTLHNVEIICVNDGSTDNCGAILEEYAAKDVRIKIITQENQGLSGARNSALKQVTGEYIAFLDSDDALHPQALEIALKVMQRHKADIVSFQYEKSDGQTWQPKQIDISKIKQKVEKHPLKFIKRGTYKFEMNVWTKLYKKEILEGLDFIRNIHFEDMPWLCAILSKRPKTIVLNVPLIFYTINQESISHQKGNAQQIKDFATGIKYVLEIYKNHIDRGLIKRCYLPMVLKHQLNRCLRASKENQKEMYKAFAEELKYIAKEKMLGFLCHKPSRYIAYRRLLKK